MSGHESLGARLMRKKPIALLVKDAADVDPSDGHLRRSISLYQLVMFGVGSTVGTGIFFALAQTAPSAGPAVIISFLIAGAVAGLSALC
jgi:basic amino acid/polyamine antiporter, APA family